LLPPPHAELQEQQQPEFALLLVLLPWDPLQQPVLTSEHTPLLQLEPLPELP
jgi:hypothetical protein